ncbi:MAG: PilZ domain-containing protein [Nitrospira sp.]|nr:PilZ domain-containing protein [Nitrospira sp.]
MEPICPKCGKDFIQRTHREGLLEQLLRVIYVYPFRCQLCSHRFLTMQWGKRYVKEADDKRQYQRIETHIPITFAGDQIEGAGVVKDISMGGCGLELAAEASRPGRSSNCNSGLRIKSRR